MFSKRWILTTILVLAASGVLARLGFWQLERLEARRAFNMRTAAQQSAPQLNLNSADPDIDFDGMEYRQVSAAGVFLFAEEIALRNQVHEGRPAFRLITPLRLSGSQFAVLVDRGYVPSDSFTPGDRTSYAQPTGEVRIQGVIRRSQAAADFGARSDPEVGEGEELLVWNLINVDRIARQLNEPVLPIYIQLSAGPEGRLGEAAHPIPAVFIPELTEGPHLGYAIQWFLFAGMLLVGYPFYYLKESRTSASLEIS